jgi:hypothetical protein
MSLIGLFVRLWQWDNRRATKEQGQALEESLDKRPRDRNFVQLSGQSCVACKRRILAQKQAHVCQACSAPIHNACAERHGETCAAPPAE